MSEVENKDADDEEGEFSWDAFLTEVGIHERHIPAVKQNFADNDVDDESDVELLTESQMESMRLTVGVRNRLLRWQRKQGDQDAKHQDAKHG